MYAVVKTGGKQYKVKVGDTIRVETMAGAPGETIELHEVLLVANDQGTRIGQPFVTGAKVVGSVVTQGKAKKIIVFKAKRRKSYRKKQGHRQRYMAVKINEIIG
jgi:large subunit ribosomal protein L21